VNIRNTARRRLEQAARALMKPFRRPPGTDSLSQQPLVLAITYCYPIRVALYAAAFRSRWNLRFIKSLGNARNIASTQRPKAVLYDHAAADPAWSEYCAALSREGVPFVSLALGSDDDTFLTVLAGGGYLACGGQLTSEGIVNAVNFAEEIAGLAHVPVV
jgi:hypothetical protein